MRHNIRSERSVPIMAELRAWLDKRKAEVPPKSKLGEALAYLDKYWPKLVRYLERGDLPAVKTVEDIEALLPWNLEPNMLVTESLN